MKMQSDAMIGGNSKQTKRGYRENVWCCCWCCWMMLLWKFGRTIMRRWFQWLTLY